MKKNTKKYLKRALKHIQGRGPHPKMDKLTDKEKMEIHYIAMWLSQTMMLHVEL